MDNRTFAGLLAATPPAGLSILELTAELTRPDGSFDLDAAAARQHGGGDWPASRRRTTPSATGRLLEALRWQLRPRRN